MIFSSKAAKRARLLHLGSDEWYLDEIKLEYRDPTKKGYQREYISEETRRVLRAYAEADFDFLGKNLSGVSNEIQQGTGVEPGFIPTRLHYKPD